MTWEIKKCSEAITRAFSVHFDKTLCFLCQEDKKSLGALHEIQSVNSGIKLRRTTNIGGSDVLKLRLSSVTNPNDTHAIDASYEMLDVYC